jgi:hypothetical protein
LSEVRWPDGGRLQRRRRPGAGRWDDWELGDRGLFDHRSSDSRFFDGRFFDGRFFDDRLLSDG